MISEQLQAPEHSSGHTLWIVAGVLIILCQMAAFAMVANGQVKKAELRDLRDASERLAVAHCLESRIGTERHSCMLQARAEAEAGNPAFVASGRQMAAAPETITPSVISGSLMPVSFSAN
jgi:hypothetical protein